MDRYVVLVCAAVCVGVSLAAPKMRVVPQLARVPLVNSNLPANWTTIREEVADTFKCEGKSYGYYADVDNDCQVFHVCLPVEGRNLTFKWSFICPGETIFNQESFTCTRSEDSVRCEDAPEFYKLNDNFGQPEEEKDENEVQNSNSIDSRSSKAGSEQSSAKRRNRAG